MMEEIWKAVEGYEGIYEVSNLGQVRSLDKEQPVFGDKGVKIRQGIIKRHNIGRTGYHYVMLVKDGIAKNHRVHRLVANAFVPNPDNLPEVNHKDENKANNRADNLEWCTSKYNANYGTRNERKAEGKRRPVLQLDKDGNVIREYASVTEAAEAVGSSSSHISRCCLGTVKGHKTVKGFYWKYKE